MASIDSTTEAPITAAEVEADPAAPASGAGAGDRPAPCAEGVAATVRRARRRRKVRDLNMVTGDDAIGK